MVLIVLFLNCVGMFLATGMASAVSQKVKMESSRLAIEQISLAISMGIVLVLVNLSDSYIQILGNNLWKWYIRFYFLGVLLGKINFIKKLEKFKGTCLGSWGEVFYI